MAKGNATRSGGGDAVIGNAARVRGRVTGDGNLLVEGKLEGDVTIRGDLTVGERATATSNVDADAVTIAGALEGDVNARGIVKILAGARVRGDMRGESVAIEEGAEFAGRLDADFELPAELTGHTGGGKRR